MTIRASQNFKLLFKTLVFVWPIHVFPSKGSQCPSSECRTEQRASGHPGQSSPEMVSFWFDLRIPVTVHSPSETGVWALFCPVPMCSGGCCLRGKRHKQKKTPCASFWPKHLEHCRRWSQPGDAASWQFRFGNLFPKVGKHSLPKSKPKTTEELETSIF